MRGISETQFNEAFVVHGAMDQLINIENCFQCLHGGATEEATATIGRGSAFLPNTESEPKTHKRRGKPDNSRDEAERFSGLPATASIVAVETTPVPDTAAAQLVNGVDKDTECGKPCKGDDDVKWPGEKSRGKWYEPYQAKED